MTMRTIFSRPLLHVSVLTAFVAVTLLQSLIVLMDDAFLYQRFTEELAGGRLDLSIAGFHGASILALPLYLLTHSPLANAYLQIICAILLVPFGYLAALSLLRDKFQATLFAYAMAMMPFFSFVALRGFTFPSFTLLVFLTIILHARGSRWTWLPLGLSFITKPFSIALSPLLLFWHPHQPHSRMKKGWMQLLLALIIPACYVALQYSQIGRIIVGAHTEIDATNVFVFKKIFLNLAHGVQMLFSVHNFYFPDPARTGPGNMVHSSPVLMMLGVFSLLYPHEFWRDKRLALCLLLSFIAAYILAGMLDHMDHFYMETSVLILALASLPVLARFRLLIPIVLATLHFQFFYLYLRYQGAFFTDLSLFLLPAAVDLLALASFLLLVLPKLTLRDLRIWR